MELVKKKLLVLGLLTLSVLTPSIEGLATQDSTLPTFPTFPNFVVIIMLENKSINQTYGAGCAGNCSYITQLANTYGLAKSYSAIGHPSLQNYLDMISGGNYDYSPFTKDCYPQTVGCSISAPNIIDRIETAGGTWKAYLEDYTGGGCTRTHNSDTKNAYANDHNPFLYFNDTFYSPARCSRIVNANPGTEGYLALPTVLLSDLNNSMNASNLMWLTPNQCNNGHSTCTTTASSSTECSSTSLAQCVSQTNKYLSMLVPRILNSAVFKTQNAALFITWDEGTNQYPRDYVSAIWVGPVIQQAHRSTVFYTHYSLLHTLETLWGLTPLTTHDATATTMSEFFSFSAPALGGGGGRVFL